MATNGDWTQDAVAWSPSQANFDFWGILNRRKMLILFMTVVGLGLGYLYYVQAEPVYESTAEILVVDRKARLPLQTLDLETGSDDLATQMLIFRSPEVVVKAVDNANLSALRSFKDVESPAGEIIRNLEPARAAVQKDEKSSSVVRLRFRSPNPEDARVVLGAVIQSYQRFLGATYKSVSDDTLSLIVRAKDEINSQITALNNKMTEVRRTSPLIYRGEKGENPFLTRLAQLQLARSQVTVDQSLLISRLASIRKELAKGTSRPAIMLMIERWRQMQEQSISERAMSRTGLNEKTFALELELELASRTLGPDHPKIEALRKQITRTRDYFDNAALDTDGDGKPNRKNDILDLYLISMEIELAHLETKEAELDRKFQLELAEAKSLEVHETQVQALQNDIERSQKLFDSVVTNLQQISLMKDYGGMTAQVVMPPTVGIQVEPSIAKVMVIAGFAGLLLGFGLAYLVDRADKSFRSPDEIRTFLGLPVLGHVPVLSREDEAEVAENSTIDATIAVFHRPKSSMAEAYRAVRTSLYFSVHGEGHKVIQITSPNPGDGKSTLASNLGAVIAASDKKILLIDADCRRPRMHKLFGLSNDIGLTDVISGLKPLSEVIKKTEIDNLYVLACGPKPANPSEMLTSQAFLDLINQVRCEFDFVLIDTPPLLAVTDPSIVAKRVDGVLLAMRINKKARPTAIRATEMLQQLQANLLGTIVNGVGQGRAYGSKSYQYAYDSRYYQYRMGGYSNYRYNDYSYDYYEDDQPAAADAAK